MGTRFDPPHRSPAEDTSEPLRYRFLPLTFDHWSAGEYLLVNEVGEFLRCSNEKFSAFTAHDLDTTEPLYADLKAKHFLVDRTSSSRLNLLAAKYRTKKGFLEGFTKLHMFVPTIRCNQSCPYCQVSRRNQESSSVFDMSEEILHRSIQLMLASPSPHITMEFQGGEPLLRFDLVKEAVRYSKECNASAGKRIDMVVCTNLTFLEDAHLDFFGEHGVLISTSVDGPAFLHDLNRPSRPPDSNHATVERNIRRAQEALGRQAVSALMTTTRESLKFPGQIVDEYIRLDLGSIFIRGLNPYGFAVKTAAQIGYSPEEFFRFYTAVLDYILEINRRGRTFAENYAGLVLRKMLTPWSVGFVDLQSPAAAGIGAVLYNYDGNVYPSDEARMLAEMEDFSFRLGNVLEDDYAAIFLGETMQTLASAGCNESLAGCAECVYRVYCGADPVRHYATQRDLFGHRPSSGFCKKNKAIIRRLFELVFTAEKDPDLERILWSWITREDQSLLRLPELCFP